MRWSDERKGKRCVHKKEDFPLSQNGSVRGGTLPYPASKENRGNITSSMGQRAGSKVGAVLDTKNKVKDKANAVKENIKDIPTQTAYAVYSAKEKAKSSVSDFKRGMVQEQQSRQSGRLEKQEQRKKNIADKRMELQKAQEARQARKTDGSATTGATRPHERPATTSIIGITVLLLDYCLLWYIGGCLGYG